MQNESLFDGGLGFQCFPKRSDRKVTGDIAVRYAGNHTPVMQIYNGTVIAYFMIRKEQIGKIRAPFPVDFICCKILVQLIICLLYTSGCSPIKAVRELGSERRETVRSLSVVGVGYLKMCIRDRRKDPMELYCSLILGFGNLCTG